MRTLGRALLITVLAGCQTPAAVEPPPYPQRDLTVVWPERHYWYPPEGRLTPVRVPPDPLTADAR